MKSNKMKKLKIIVSAAEAQEVLEENIEVEEEAEEMLEVATIIKKIKL